MKKLFLVFTFLSFFYIANAQQRERVDTRKDRMMLDQYTIILRNAVDFTYGYEIRKGKQLIIEQKDNPIIPMTKGLLTKADAFNLAEWVISKIKETGELPKNYPPSLFEELRLTHEAKH
ncbi:hypothetical protein BH11BAC5_BH11BAC5_45420 [soil metagenome]